MTYATITLTLHGKEISFTIAGEKNLQIELLHAVFKELPDFKETCTEALLLFDTEAGGQSMDLQSAPAEKEAQP